MKFAPVKVVHVYYKPEEKKIYVGRLAIKSHRVFFEYDRDFLTSGLNLSPFKLPLKTGVISPPSRIFDGLFGVFNDSLPDGWGRLLLDRALMKHRLNPDALSVLDRLCFVGAQGMGALTYEPEIESAPLISHVDLDTIAEEIVEFQVKDDDRFVEDLLKLGGSSAGARPKVILSIGERRDHDQWLIKFRSSLDPKDSGAIEYAYHLMAEESGLEVPEAKLFPSRKGDGFFGTKRFDRAGGKRVHIHTVSGLLHADHTVPSLDYEMIIKATMHLTRDMRECEKQYRQCVFNILSHNRDDHAKNFSFLMDSHGTWKMAPSYDLTFSSGPGGEHCSMVMGEGKNPGLFHLLELAKVSNIKEKTALNIIDEVKSSITRWATFAKEAGVSKVNQERIGHAIREILKQSF